MSAVKLKDIAQEMGISVVTVSNALSGKKGVSEALRAEVEKTARRMGYDTARYGRKQDGETRIGVVVSKRYIGIGTSFYWALYQQVAYEASRRSCFTLLALTETDPALPLPPIIWDKSLDGILIIGKIGRRQRDQLAGKVSVPVVSLDFCDPGLSGDAVMSDNYMGMYRATRYLLERGHERIGFVGSIRENGNIMERYYGFRRAMEEYRLPVHREWVLEDREPELGKIEITLPQRLPTAFVCNSDFSAGYLYDGLKAKGYLVPEDISIISYDNYLFGHPFAGSLTSYNVDMAGMAKAAVSMLLKKIRYPERRMGVRYIDSYIVERDSVKTLRKRMPGPAGA